MYVHRRELEFAYLSAKTDVGSVAYWAPDFDHDLNWQVLHRDREEHFTDLEFVRFPGHTPGLTGSVIHLDSDGTVVFTGDQVYMDENYEAGTPLGGPLVWGKTEWAESMNRIRELERRHDAEVVFGHDPEQFEAIQPGWGV